jgi:hypothetical protein
MNDYALKNLMSLPEKPENFLKALHKYIKHGQGTPEQIVECTRDACIFWIMDRNKAKRG